MDLDSQVNESMLDISDFNLYVNGSLSSSQHELENLRQQIEQISETIKNIQNQVESVLTANAKNSVYFKNLMSV